MRFGLRFRNCEMLSSYRARWALYCASWCVAMLALFLLALRLLPRHSGEQLVAIFLLLFPTLMSLAATGYFTLGAFCARFVRGDRKLKCFGMPR